MSFRAIILGTGDAFSARHYGSSCLVEAPGGPVLVDCPDPIHRVLHEASLTSGASIDPAAILDVVITHLHGDHVNGLEAFGFSHWLLRRREKVRARPRVHAIREVADRLWERLAPSMDQGGTATLADYFDLRILVPGQPSVIAGLTVGCRRTTHMIPTAGLRLRLGAHSIGWSSDTGFEQAHVDWLAECGIFVHETSPPPFHTDIAELIAQPERIRRRMRLIHAPDEFDAAACPIPLLKPGDIVTAC